MKRVILIFLTSLLLVGCGTSVSNLPIIEDGVWYMTTVQGTSQNTDSVIACNGELGAIYDDAWVLDVILTASDGLLEIQDLTNSLKFYGEYKLYNTAPETRTYAITTETSGGYAVIGKKKLINEDGQTVLILSIGDYVINFSKQ